MEGFFKLFGVSSRMESTGKNACILCWGFSFGGWVKGAWRDPEGLTVCCWSNIMRCKKKKCSFINPTDSRVNFNIQIYDKQKVGNWKDSPPTAKKVAGGTLRLPLIGYNYKIYIVWAKIFLMQSNVTITWFINFISIKKNLSVLGMLSWFWLFYVDVIQCSKIPITMYFISLLQIFK